MNWNCVGCHLYTWYLSQNSFLFKLVKMSYIDNNQLFNQLKFVHTFSANFAFHEMV